jgi:hypothetical protein
MAKPKLSKASQELLDSLVDSAKQWGWVEDQGYGSMVKRTLSEFEEDRDALAQRIAKLERENRKLRLENKDLATGPEVKGEITFHGVINK